MTSPLRPPPAATHHPRSPAFFPGLAAALAPAPDRRATRLDARSTHGFAAASTAEAEPLSDVLRRAGRKALGGGVPGAVAMGANVLTLMPMRTLVNRQYR